MNKVLRLLLLCIGCGAAHDIPGDATAQAIIRADNHTLQVIVRVPLNVIRDIQIPENESGYLDIEKLTPLLPAAVKVQIADLMEIHEGSRLLPRPEVSATQISLESDRSLDTFDNALRHVRLPKPSNSMNLIWSQLFLDALLEYPIESDESHFFIRPGFERMAGRVVTLLRFVEPRGDVRAYQFTGDPGLVPLDPSWFQAAKHFVAMGFSHILDGIDHLLFLLCLVIPIRKIRSLIGVVTAFTAAHSITLAGSAYGFAPDRLWFPPLVETLIAGSIVYMALENIVSSQTSRRRWLVAFGFGLVHGFGFSFALRENLQLAGRHLLTSLLAFNVGVELGQVFALLLLIPLLDLLFRFVVAERIGTIILSALVAHTGWHWLLERADNLRQFR